MTEIVTAAPHEYDAALTLLFNQLPPSEQKAAIADVLSALRRGRIANHGVLIAKRDGRIVGSILYLMQQDRTAFVWPPAAAGERVPNTDDALLGEVVRRIGAADAWIGQCLLEVDRHTERAILERHGFRHLTDLRFLVRRLEYFPGALPITGPDGELLETVTYQPGVNEARFARLIERTYVKTRDCPELEGTRTGEQALVSHQMSGEFDPDRWRLYRWHDQDAGVLLMNDHPEQSSWEVVYLGVAHDCRGHNLGRRMLYQGLVAARAAQRFSVLLAVDWRNEYAGKLYDELGFVECDRRAVHLYLPSRPLARARDR
jgi:GNAT superfamily N-acetyltransferase